MSGTLLDTAAFEHHKNGGVSTSTKSPSLISERVTYIHEIGASLEMIVRGLARSGWQLNISWRMLDRDCIERSCSTTSFRRVRATPPPSVPTKHNELHAMAAKSRAPWLRHRPLGSEPASRRTVQRHPLAQNAKLAQLDLTQRTLTDCNRFRDLLRPDQSLRPAVELDSDERSIPPELNSAMNTRLASTAASLFQPIGLVSYSTAAPSSIATSLSGLAGLLDRSRPGKERPGAWVEIHICCNFYRKLRRARLLILIRPTLLE